MKQFEIEIDKPSYSRFKEFEGLKGKDCFDKGMRKGDTISLTLPLTKRYNVILSQTVPNSEDAWVYATATLHDLVLDRYIDTFEVDDTIQGEWHFQTNDDEISINIISR